jgi:hypothetical protein
MTCQKCKGLMIAESRPDYSTDGTVLRCINCGLVLDPLHPLDSRGDACCMTARDPLLRRSERLALRRIGQVRMSRSPLTGDSVCLVTTWRPFRSTGLDICF